MASNFSYEQFEKLDGLPLAFYTIEVCKEGKVPVDFIDYFKTHATRWTGPRLEVAIGLLRKLDTAEARHLLSDYLNHPLQHIRFTVYMILDRMKLIDDYVLARIDEFAHTPERVREFGGTGEIKRFRDQAMSKLVS